MVIWEMRVDSKTTNLNRVLHTIVFSKGSRESIIMADEVHPNCFGQQYSKWNLPGGDRWIEKCKRHLFCVISIPRSQ